MTAYYTEIAATPRRAKARRLNKPAQPQTSAAPFPAAAIVQTGDIARLVPLQVVDFYKVKT